MNSGKNSPHVITLKRKAVAAALANVGFFVYGRVMPLEDGRTAILRYVLRSASRTGAPGADRRAS